MITRRKFVVCNPQKCDGCRVCEFACSATKHKLFNPLYSRIKTTTVNHGTSFSLACCLCQEPACVPSCPRTALRQDESGIIRVDEDLCNGCGLCAYACDWGVIALYDVRPVVEFCDFCDGDPACVKACPQEALSLVTVGDMQKTIASDDGRRFLERLFEKSGNVSVEGEYENQLT